MELLNGDERDGWTIIKFRRELAACEVDSDQEITVRDDPHCVHLTSFHEIACRYP